MVGQTESIGSNVEKVKVLVAQSCLTLCNPMDCSPPGSSVHGILQARMLEWVAMPFSRGSSWHRGRIWVSCVAGRLFTIWAPSCIHSLLQYNQFPGLRTTHIFYCTVSVGQEFRRGLAGWFWDRVVRLEAKCWPGMGSSDGLTEAGGLVMGGNSQFLTPRPYHWVIWVFSQHTVGFPWIELFQGEGKEKFTRLFTT